MASSINKILLDAEVAPVKKFKFQAIWVYKKEDIKIFLIKIKKNRKMKKKLVSTSKAAKILGISSNSFKNRYVLPNRMGIFKKKGSAMYFLKEEVENLQKLGLISAGEVAEILNLKPNRIHQLRIQNKLTVVSGSLIDGFGYNLYLHKDILAVKKIRNI